MPIDPVVLLAQEIRGTEAELKAQCKLNAIAYDRKRAENINLMLGKVRALYTEQLDTLPSSALGAGELVRIVSYRLPFSCARHAAQLNEIAGRLGAGERLQSDLIWLRDLTHALTAGEPDARNRKTAQLLTRAIRGAARPVMVYRAVSRPRSAAADLQDLSPAFWKADLPALRPPLRLAHGAAAIEQRDVDAPVEIAVLEHDLVGLVE